MNAGAYRGLKWLAGLATLGFSLLAFSDVPGWISAKAIHVGLWLQFTPSVMRLVQGFSWMAAGAVAVVVLTLLFGRVYCAMLCPLGVLMDVTAWLGRRSGKRRRLPFRPGRPWLRALSVLTVLGGVAAGTAIPLAFLDPSSVFGKITASTVRPLAGWANHGLAALGFGTPADVSPTSWAAAGVGAALLLLVVLSALWRGRLWCNTVCPVGAVLGVLSRHSLFRLGISESACVACSLCEKSCPSQCIDFRNFRIDHSRCVMCFDCVGSCRKSGISLKFAWPWQTGAAPRRPDVGPQHAQVLPPIGRRSFLAASAALPTLAFAKEETSHEREGRHRRKRGDGHACECKHGLNQHNKRPVLPPGAVSEARFRNLCTACHLCVANCPDQVLRPAVHEGGLAGFLQPFQDFEVSFCSYNCSNCSNVCPTGALQPITVPERRLIQTGVAKFFRGRCIVRTDGTSCGACSEHCPTQAVHMVPWKDGLTIPEVNPDLCVGCGGCEFICPARPHKAIIVEALAVHGRAKPVERGEKNLERPQEEEFPF